MQEARGETPERGENSSVEMPNQFSGWLDSTATAPFGAMRGLDPASLAAGARNAPTALSGLIPLPLLSPIIAGPARECFAGRGVHEVAAHGAS